MKNGPTAAPEQRLDGDLAAERALDSEVVAAHAALAEHAHDREIGLRGVARQGAAAALAA